MTTDTPPSAGFTITRRFDASVDELWAAWTDPDELQHWLHPRGVHTPPELIEVDLRVGGRYRYTMVSDATGDEYPTGGEYLEVSPPTRLVFTWGYPDASPAESPRISVELDADGDGCVMTFTIERLDAAHDDIRTGWDQALDVLGEHLERVR